METQKIIQMNVRFGPEQMRRIDAAAKSLRVSMQSLVRAGAMEVVERVESTTDAAGRLGLAVEIDRTGAKE
jgi:hypothetical protein